MSSSSSASLDSFRAVLTSTREIVIEKCAAPSGDDLPAFGVLIRMQSIGICGSDVHYYAHGRCGNFVTSGPLVLGHESSGVIVARGSSVQNVNVGDRVAIEPGVPCFGCSDCTEGRYNLCAEMSFLATPPVHGSLASYLVHDARMCFALPDNVSFDEAALLEPVSVGVYACERGRVGAGDTVLIQGAGPIGLVSMMAARAYGASTIIVTDVNADRLARAKQLGANHAISAVGGDGALPATVRALTFQKRGVDVAIDASGSSQAIGDAILSTRSGGRVCLVGRSSEPTLSLPIWNAADREVDIVGVFRYRNQYRKALELVASKQIDPAPIITHHFESFDEIVNAFVAAESGKGPDGQSTIKCMIHL
jgi:L-iditol 2-dehydrogenase